MPAGLLREGPAVAAQAMFQPRLDDYFTKVLKLTAAERQQLLAKKTLEAR